MLNERRYVLLHARAEEWRAPPRSAPKLKHAATASSGSVGQVGDDIHRLAMHLNEMTDSSFGHTSHPGGRLMSIASIPIAFFAFLAVVIIVPIWLRNRTRALALQTISEAIAKNRETDVALIERLLLAPQPAVGKGFALLNLFLGIGALGVGTALALAARVLRAANGAGAAEMMIGSCVNLGIASALITLGIVSMRLFSGLRRPAPRWDFAAVLALAALFLGASGLGIGAGLAVAANTFVAPAMGEATASGMKVGALVNCCSGVAFTGLGSFILRTFTLYKGS